MRRVEYRVGDRVLLTGDRSGVVRWIGRFDSEFVSNEVFVGVQLDDACEREREREGERERERGRKREGERKRNREMF